MVDCHWPVMADLSLNSSSRSVIRRRHLFDTFIVQGIPFISSIYGEEEFSPREIYTVITIVFYYVHIILN